MYPYSILCQMYLEHGIYIKHSTMYFKYQKLLDQINHELCLISARLCCKDIREVCHVK
jgi:hypothetical protein